MVHFLPLPFFYAIPLSGQYPVCVSLAVKAAISFWDSPTCSRFSLSCTFINNEKVHLWARVRNIISFLSWMMATSCPYPFCSNPHPPPPHHIRLMAMRGLTRAATIILLSYPESPTEADHSHMPPPPWCMGSLGNSRPMTKIIYICQWASAFSTKRSTIRNSYEFETSLGAVQTRAFSYVIQVIW